MLARYFMYSQVYFHPVRRVYDIHLKDFLKEWLPNGAFSTELDVHLALTDNEVTAAIYKAAFEHGSIGHASAKRIVQREHFKQIYERNPEHVRINPEAGFAIYDALCSKFGSALFRHDRYHQRSGAPDFPVRLHDGQIVSSVAMSETLQRVPPVSVDYVFADRSTVVAAEKWLAINRSDIIKPKEEGA